MAFQIVPSVDLRDGRVVRLRQGDYGQQTSYDVDPFDAARSYAGAGAGWFHIVDLDGAKEGHPVQTELIARLINATRMNVQVGGGVRCTADVERLIQAGARRVVVGTKALEDWPWFEGMSKRPDLRDRLVLALDAKDGVVATRGWTESSGRLAADVACAVRGWPLAAILYTDVARDGMLQGPNVEQTRRLVESTDVPVLASGGVGNLEHISRIMTSGAWGVIVGRSLYEGTLDLREAIRLAH